MDQILLRALTNGSREGAVRLRFLVLIFLSVAIGVPDIVQAAPRVVAKVDLSQQRMRVIVNGRTRHSWRVSTGRRGYRTPTGRYTVKRMHRMWRSRKYYNSPMPHSIFFRGGYAIHGTYDTKRLGRPASHGCIRLHPAHAKRLFALTKRYGRRNMRVVITR